MHNKDEKSQKSSKKSIEEDFDEWVTHLQEIISEKDKKDFSAYALDLARNPYHYGSLPESKDVYSCAWRGPCGDMIKFYLNIQNDFIQNASFEVDGCATSVMAASQTIKLIENNSISVAFNLREEDLLNALGKFPPESLHCCTLAITTLKKVLVLYSNS